MTCIVAIKEDGRVYLGADSASSDDEADMKTIAVQPKIFKSGPVAIGFCGSWRAGKVFQYDLVIPKIDTDDIDRYMNTTFINALQECAERNRLVIDESKPENDLADLIVAINGRIFEVQSHVQSLEHIDDFFAVGSGAKFALGSLYTTQDFDLTPKERLKLALDAASKYSMSVAPPYTYLTK